MGASSASSFGRRKTVLTRKLVRVPCPGYRAEHGIEFLVRFRRQQLAPGIIGKVAKHLEVDLPEPRQTGSRVVPLQARDLVDRRLFSRVRGMPGIEESRLNRFHRSDENEIRRRHFLADRV
jgi:hypothetical protein